MATQGLTNAKPLLQFAEATGLKKYRFILEDPHGHRYTHTLYVTDIAPTLHCSQQCLNSEALHFDLGKHLDVTDTEHTLA